MPIITFAHVAISKHDFNVAIMFDGKGKYNYDLIKEIITDVKGNIINNPIDEALIKKAFKSKEFLSLKEEMLERKEDNMLVC